MPNPLYEFPPSDDEDDEGGGEGMAAGEGMASGGGSARRASAVRRALRGLLMDGGASPRLDLERLEYPLVPPSRSSNAPLMGSIFKRRRDDTRHAPALASAHPEARPAVARIPELIWDRMHGIRRSRRSSVPAARRPDEPAAHAPLGGARPAARVEPHDDHVAARARVGAREHDGARAARRRRRQRSRR
eukprot:1783098-Prymnesium_polylepis.1